MFFRSVSLSQIIKLKYTETVYIPGPRPLWNRVTREKNGPRARHYRRARWRRFWEYSLRPKSPGILRLLLRYTQLNAISNIYIYIKPEYKISTFPSIRSSPASPIPSSDEIILFSVDFSAECRGRRLPSLHIHLACARLIVIYLRTSSCLFCSRNPI